MFKLTEKLIAHPDFPMETEISYDDHYLKVYYFNDVYSAYNEGWSLEGDLMAYDQNSQNRIKESHQLLVGLDYLDGVDGYSSATNDQFEMLAIKAKALLNS
tara:strand:+ start:147 stop:449 length:303 start_codon:yes stop_codon:yes gene_type:complete